MAQIKKISTELQTLDKLLDSSGDAGTSGQILSSTGSGTNWISASSGTITGSGTTGYIPKWTGSSALGDSILEVNSALPNDVIMPQYIRHRGDTNTYFGFYSNDTIIAATSGNEVMRINSGGTVLVNKTSPAASGAKFSINGMAEFETSLTDNDDWENSPISIGERGNVGSSQTADKYAPNLNFHWGGVTSKSLWMGADGHLSFGEYQSNGTPTANGTFLVGTIGIGTISPNRKLTVIDAGAANGSQNITAQFSNQTSGATSSAIYIGASSGADWLIGKNIYGVSSQTYFQIGNQSGTTPALTIAHTTNNVGIGTTSPSEKLHVFNAGYPQLNLESNAGSWQIGVSTGNDFAFRKGSSGSNYPLWLDSSGNVGIGTTSPAAKLEVNGGTKLGGGSLQVTTDSTYLSNYNYTFRDAVGINNPNDTSAASSSTTVMAIGAKSGGTVNTSLITTGAIGIGTTNPNESLEVSGNIRASGSYKVGATDVISSGRRFFAADGSNTAPAYSFSGRTDTGMYAEDHGSNDRIRFAVDGTNRFFIDGNGINIAAGNLYLPSGNSVRNYSGVWAATTGQTGNGFTFANTADNSSAILLSITSVASAATDSVATFSGKVKSAQTASSDGNDVLTTKSYVDGLVTGVTRYMGLWDARTSAEGGSGAGGDPDLTASTYKVPGYYFIVSHEGTATPNGAGTEPNTWHVGDWVIWSDQATDAWQKIDNTSVLSGTGTANKVAMWNGDESLTNAPITISGDNSTFTGVVKADGGNIALGNISGAARLQHEASGQLKMLSSGDSHIATFTSTLSTFANDVTIGDDLNISGEELTFTNDAASAYIRAADALLIQSDYNTGENKPIYLQPSAVTELKIETGLSTFAGDVRINGSHLVLANGTTEAQSTDYLYIGGDGLASADAAIYIGNGGSGDNVGWRLFYEGTGTGNDNKFIIKSENSNNPIDALSFTQDGRESFGSTVYILSLIHI